MTTNKQVLITIFLQEAVWLRTIGPMPHSILLGCSEFVSVPQDWDGVITNDMKDKLITKFWVEAGGTGGFKRQEKVSYDLFSFSL